MKALFGTFLTSNLHLQTLFNHWLCCAPRQTFSPSVAIVNTTKSVIDQVLIFWLISSLFFSCAVETRHVLMAPWRCLVSTNRLSPSTLIWTKIYCDFSILISGNEISLSRGMRLVPTFQQPPTFLLPSARRLIIHNSKNPAPVNHFFQVEPDFARQHNHRES